LRKPCGKPSIQPQVSPFCTKHTVFTISPFLRLSAQPSLQKWLCLHPTQSSATPAARAAPVRAILPPKKIAEIFVHFVLFSGLQLFRCSPASQGCVTHLLNAHIHHTHTSTIRTHRLEHVRIYQPPLSCRVPASTPFFAPLPQCMCEFRTYPTSEHRPLPQISQPAFGTKPSNPSSKGSTRTRKVSHQNISVNKRPPIQLFSRLSLFGAQKTLQLRLNTPCTYTHTPHTHLLIKNASQRHFLGGCDAANTPFSSPVH